ncbi:MAG: class I SAM-dependent methyltransferase [Deltaproteobacteria bacterium]|nr:class I SAM-dependent methyltransferase [Deltaproteobacteria bacterium]
MDKPMPNLAFQFMSLAFKVRDFLLPRKDVLNEVGIKPGFHILDYGCGPGSYSVIAAGLVGPKGKVYALDIHPLAIRRVQEKSAKMGLTNIHTISSDRETGLEDAAVDVVLLYDTFHHLSDSDALLKELHRVLKPAGILSFSDHHMKEGDILSQVTHKGLFKLSKKGRKTYCFLKEKG